MERFSVSLESSESPLAPARQPSTYDPKLSKALGGLFLLIMWLLSLVLGFTWGEAWRAAQLRQQPTTVLEVPLIQVSGQKLYDYEHMVNGTRYTGQLGRNAPDLPSVFTHPDYSGTLTLRYLNANPQVHAPDPAELVLGISNEGAFWFIVAMLPYWALCFYILATWEHIASVLAPGAMGSQSLGAELGYIALNSVSFPLAALVPAAGVTLVFALWGTPPYADHAWPALVVVVMFIAVYALDLQVSPKMQAARNGVPLQS